jgi:hypothetical protein
MELTTERELTQRVDLCLPGGRRLDPAARGWSRRPLHRANLAGGWGRTKRWDYWAVLTDELFVSVTYADVDYIGLLSVSWGEVLTGRRGGRTAIVPLAVGVSLPDVPGALPLHHAGRHLRIDLVERVDGSHLTAHWDEPDGTTGELDVVVALPDGHESLNVVIPWSDTRFQYTSKHQARPVSGVAVVGGRTHVLGGTAGDEAWGVLDVGRGRWPYRTDWNWGGGAGRSTDGRVVGLQLGGKWTVGTGFTENGVIIDGRLHKIVDELDWCYDWGRPLDPWRVRGARIGLDLELRPTFDRHERTAAVVLETEVHQVFGRWAGTLPDGEGGTLTVDGLVGFAEESRSRW